MPKVRIVHISDTHLFHTQLGQPKLKFPKGDILIHSGDATFEGSVPEMQDFFKWFKSIGHIPIKIFVAGNHDWLHQKDSGLAKSLVPKSIIYLEDSGIQARGINFYGSPWQPEFQNWAFNLPRNGNELRHRWSLIPRDTDVLITHGPPNGILDHTYHGEHVGCEQLQKAISTRDILLHCFGHVHHAYGTRAVGNMVFSNGAVLDEAYNLARKPNIFDVDPVARTCEIVK